MSSLTNPAAFFAYLRKGRYLGPELDRGEVDGCTIITTKAGRANWPIAWVAYALATAYHETAGTMRPIKEYGGERYFFRMYDINGARPQVARRLGNVRPGDGVLFCGRGFPQTTGRNNYERADRKLNLGGELVRNPDLMLNAQVAADTMILGMAEGWFTDVRCDHYLPKIGLARHPHFRDARQIINGRDRDDDIAEYAVHFQEALAIGGWQ